MRKVLLTLALLGLASAAYATPEDLSGGVFAAHYVPEIVYSSDPPPDGWCGAYAPYAIGDLADVNATVTVPDFSAIVWYVLAAWEEEDKEWCGTEFGFGTYDPYVILHLQWEPCYPPTGGLEIPTAGWPGPDEGIAFVVTGDPWFGNWLPVYVLGSYCYGYYGASTLLPLAPDPATGFVGFSNCTAPPASFEVGPDQLGALGINVDGVVPMWPTPPPEWACCFDTGECRELTEVGCDQAGGVWYPDLTCDPNPCPQPGACCVGGICSVLMEEDCNAAGGEWLGPGTTCEPNPCPAVCCFEMPTNPHGCEIILEDDCIAMGGYWHPEWTTCEPNPCEIYTPAENTSWGTIKGMYR
jgi:hypothetical protein